MARKHAEANAASAESAAPDAAVASPAWPALVFGGGCSDVAERDAPRTAPRKRSAAPATRGSALVFGGSVAAATEVALIFGGS